MSQKIKLLKDQKGTTEFSVTQTTDMLFKSPDSEDLPCRQSRQWESKLKALLFFSCVLLTHFGFPLLES